MASIGPIQVMTRIGAPGAPPTLLPGQLAYNQPDIQTPQTPGDILYVGDGLNVNELVGAGRQVELWGDQTITGTKTIDVTNLKLTGGQAQWLLTTDGDGNISWTNAPGGGLTQVATDGVTLSGTGTTADPLAVVPETVAVAVDGATLGGSGLTLHPLFVVPESVPVATDGVTLHGTGVAASPLSVVADSVAVATNATLSGNGTTASPLGVVADSVPVATNATLSGNGTTASPLGVVAASVAVATDGLTITGNGTTAFPLEAVGGTVAVVADNVTIGGEGLTASPLHVLPNSVQIAANSPLTGNGTNASPLALANPLPLLYGGTGVSASSNATLLTALGAASVASLAAYLQLVGGTMSGLIVLSGNATANLNPVPLQQMNTSIATAVAAVPANSYGTTAPASPVTGTLWFNPTSGALQMWSGSAWTTITSGPPVTTVTLQGDATGTG
jgi:hypothetical protein